MVTVTQRIIASNHNYTYTNSARDVLSHKESLHQITTSRTGGVSIWTLSHKESLHQITTNWRQERTCRRLSHKESLHQITTRRGRCGKSPRLSHKESLHQITTVPLDGVSRPRLSHKESLHQITTEEETLGGIALLSHKESLHQITTTPCERIPLSNCHTKNHCIKSQLGNISGRGRVLLSHKESLHQITTVVLPHCQKRRLSHKESLHQITTETVMVTFKDGTVTQRIIASNHNTAKKLPRSTRTVTQRIIASIMSKNYVGSIAKFGLHCVEGGVQLWGNGPYFAECNEGATKPEENGYCFWWGDTVGYKRNSSNNGWVSVKEGTTIKFSSFDATAGQTCGKTIDPLKTARHIDATTNLVARHDAARRMSTASRSRAWSSRRRSATTSTPSRASRASRFGASARKAAESGEAPLQ